MERHGDVIRFTDDEQDLFGVPPEVGDAAVPDIIMRLEQLAAQSNEQGLALQQSPYPAERAAGQRIRIHARRVNSFSTALFEVSFVQPDETDATEAGDQDL